MKNIKKILILSILVNNISYSMLSTSNTIKLKESYINSDYVEVQKLKPTKNIIVIEKKDFIDKGYKNVSDILDDIPSINIGKTGWGSIDIRGQGIDSADKNLQILLDGAPITNLINHPLQTNYDVVPVENIERIEIVPSGGSILYGSGTVGGVINITTNLKRIARASKTVGINYGTNLKEYNLSLGHNLTNNLAAQLTYTNSKRDLYFKNTYRNTQYFSSGLNYKINDNHDISFRYSLLDENGKFIRSITARNLEKAGKDYIPEDKTITIGLDNNGKKIQGKISGYSNAKRELETFNFTYNWKINEDIKYSLDSFYNKGNFDNSNLGNLTMYHKTKGFRNKLSYDYAKNTNFVGSSVLFGFDYYIQSADLHYDDYRYNRMTRTYYIKPLAFEYDKKTIAFYILNNLKYGNFDFSQGIRKDYTYWGFNKIAAQNAGKGTSKRLNTNYELALAYNYRDTGKIYARYERSFTSPDGLEITDDYSKTDIYPTKGKDTIYDIYEIGLRDKIGFSTVVLTAFYNKTDNEMTRNLVLDPNLGLGRYSINILKTKRKGIELTLSQKFGNLTLEESYAYLKGVRKYNSEAVKYKDKLIDWTDAGLKKVPKHSFTLKASYAFNDSLSATIKYKYSGKYTNFTDENEIKGKEEEKFIKSYSLVDVGLNFKAENGITLSVGVNNIFNTKYYEYVGDAKYTVQPAEERTYYMGVRYTF